jgi:hypothetical protein
VYGVAQISPGRIHDVIPSVPVKVKANVLVSKSASPDRRGWQREDDQTILTSSGPVGPEEDPRR